MSTVVQTPVFEGPFDLLLHLIVREEVELYDISLSEIVDAYLVELERMEGLELDLATEFLLIAATLVELKSRRLLPDDSDFDLEDELGLWEERDLLLARLLECKTFKNASGALEGLARRAGRSHPRTAGLEPQFLDLVPDLLENVVATDLRAAFIRATAPRPQPTVDLFHVTPVKLTVAETVAGLLDELPSMGRTTFHDLTRSLVDRVEVVVHFLAILEIYKQGLVELTQLQTFGGITIDWTGGQAFAVPADIDIYEG